MNGLCMTPKSDTKAPQGNWAPISGESWSYHNLRKTIIKLGYNSLDDFVWRYMLKNDSGGKKAWEDCASNL